jgi:hypothetical protein
MMPVAVSSKRLVTSAAEQALQSKLKEQSSTGAIKTSTLIGAGFAIALIGLIVLRGK